jgi:hypothetical protein
MAMNYIKLIKVVLATLLLSLILFSCDKWLKRKHSLEVRNNNIFAIKFLVAPQGLGPIYPDTSLSMLPAAFKHVKPQGTSEILISFPWSELFAYQRSDTMSIYIVHPDTLAKYPWDTIRATYNILQRYDISAQDYENRKGVFEYPYDSSLGKLKVFRK